MTSSIQWTWVWVSSGNGQEAWHAADHGGHKELGTTEWMNWTYWWTEVPLFPGFFTYNQQCGTVKLISSPPRGTIPAGTIFNQPVALVIMDNFSSIWSKFWLWSYDHRKIKMIFDKVVTIFFRLQRKLEGKTCSPCSLRDSQESSPTPQFKGINSSTLSLLYGPALTSMHDHWKNHTFHWMDLWW